MGTKRKNTRRVSVLLTPKEFEDLRRICHGDRITKTQFFRSALKTEVLCRKEVRRAARKLKIRVKRTETGLRLEIPPKTKR